MKIYYFDSNMREVGKIYSEHIGAPDDINCHITDAGLHIRIHMSNPTENELLQLSSKADIQFKLLKTRGIIFILVKFGSLQWMDAPYNVNLARNLSRLPSFEDGTGFFTSIEVYDTSSGKLCLQRNVSLPVEMSKQLVSYMEEQLKEPFSMYKMAVQLHKMYETYSTKELLKFASRPYYIRHDQ